MKPVALSDASLAAIFDAARPLPVHIRDSFLKDVAVLLSDCGEIGDGAVYRAVMQVQKRYFDPPDLGQAGGRMPRGSKWERTAAR
jgi:hypothetical protein